MEAARGWSRLEHCHHYRDGSALRAHRAHVDRALVGPVAVGEEAIMSNAMKAARQHVEQETPHELADVEAHDFALVSTALPIVLPAETDVGLVEIEQAAVGDRDAMRIAREIGQDLLGTGEGLFGIDDPFSLAQRREVRSERVRILESAEIGEELQLAGGVHGFKTLQEQAPEQAGEYAERKKEAGLAGNPTLAIRR